MNTLISKLNYEPVILKFGTSGRRGDVVHLTQLEIYINALAELEYLQSIPLAEGGIIKGDVFYYAYDLRPSSSMYVAEEKGRGEIAQAIEQAILDAGMLPVNLGQIPTPALSYHALMNHKGSMMITGSHIPFERNGYKTNTSIGELLKKDEIPVNQQVDKVRERIYHQPYEESIFNEQGLFKTGHRELSPEDGAAREGYIQRYLDFFTGNTLAGKKLLVYQHSAVGRDLVVEILERLGATVIPAGRSNTFVPIDTENIDNAQLAVIQSLANQTWIEHGPFDAVVSTDGDSDRPLLLSVEPGDPCTVRFFGGDLVGMIVAEFLQADAVVVPISCNDAIDHGSLKERVEPKTRIGSPFVIAGMQKACIKGKQVVCGWEANGGFLTGSIIQRNGNRLHALPTRDAVLPILGVLFSMIEHSISMNDLFARLPKRYSRAALLKHFPRSASLQILDRLSPSVTCIKEVHFLNDSIRLYDENGQSMMSITGIDKSMTAIREQLQRYFKPEDRFGEVIRLNYTDGVRIYFSNGDVAHVRPSGNADELRIYAVADTQTRADAISTLGVAEPNGILRSLEHGL